MKSDRFYIKNELIVTSTNLMDGQRYILSLHPLNIELPSIYWTIDNQNGLRELFSKHLKLDINWARPEIQLASLEMPHNDTVILMYSCVIPYDSQLIESYWIEVSKISSQNILTALGRHLDKLY